MMSVTGRVEADSHMRYVLCCRFAIVHQYILQERGRVPCPWSLARLLLKPFDMRILVINGRAVRCNYRFVKGRRDQSERRGQSLRGR